MPDKPPLVAVLAAGAGRRFGGRKLDADLAGKSVGQWVLDAVAATGLPPGVIVVPGQTPQFAVASGWEMLTNDRAAEGMGTSLALAAKAALAQGRHLLVLLADMPLVTPEHLRALLAAGEAATAYPDGHAGVPALLGRTLLTQATQLDGNSGAGPLMSLQTGLTCVAAPPDLLLDVDRPDDLARAITHLHRAKL